MMDDGIGIAISAIVVILVAGWDFWCWIKDGGDDE